MGEDNRPRVVLLVEDTEDDANLVFRACRSITPEVIVVLAKTALEAVEVFGGIDEPVKFFDLVILDGRLPGSSGLELLASFRIKDPERLVPVVIFSSILSPSFTAKAFEEGVVACVEKPVGYDEYLRAVYEIVSSWAGNSIRRGPEILHSSERNVDETSSAPQES